MTITQWFLALSLSASLLACSGGDDSCGAPLTITPGVWCATITSAANTCGQPVDTDPWEVTFTQDGSAVTATSEYGAVYDGTLCGSEGVFSASAPGVTVSMNVTFSDPSTLAATVDWQWEDPVCSGTDTAVVSAGACP